MIRPALALTLLLALEQARAVQFLDATRPDSQLAKISQQEVTRIAFERSRIRRVTGNAGEFVIEKDEDRGQIYLRPAGTGTKPVNIFLGTDHHTVALLLQPVDGPADSIVIREPGLSAGPERRAQHPPPRTTTHVRQLKALLRTMATEERPGGVSVAEPGRSFTLRPGVRMVLERTWTTPTHAGEKYRIATTSDAKDTALAERDFHRPGVQAVSLERTPGTNAYFTVYVIRSRGSGD